MMAAVGFILVAFFALFLENGSGFQFNLLNGKVLAQNNQITSSRLYASGPNPRGVPSKAMKKQMEAMKTARKRNPDVPYFQLYVRPKTNTGWLPFAEFEGDQKATALVNAWLSGFLRDFYKGQMDQGIANSIYQNEQKVLETTKNIRVISKYTIDELVFGYKVNFKGVEEKIGKQEVYTIKKPSEQQQKGWFDNVKDSLSNLFSFQNTEEEGSEKTA
jgi:hypothetical protein